MATLLKRLLQVETLVAGLFYALAASLLFADVIGREVFSQSIWGSQRSAVLLANGAALIGISVAVSLNRHIRPSLLDFAAPKTMVPGIKRVGSLISSVVMFSGAYFALLLVLGNKDMGFTTPPLKLEIWIPQLALPYGLASAGLKYFVFAFLPDLEPEESEVNG